MLPKATDEGTAERLWEMSCDLVKLEGHLREISRSQKFLVPSARQADDLAISDF